MLRFDGFIFTLLNLVVLYVAMRHFLIGPIQNVLAARKEMIDKQFATAQSKEDEAMQLKQRYDGLLENAKEESKQIVEESRTRAGKEYEERVQKAERQANRILEKAKQDVENEREQAMEAMQKQIAGVAMAAACCPCSSFCRCQKLYSWILSWSRKFLCPRTFFVFRTNFSGFFHFFTFYILDRKNASCCIPCCLWNGCR